MDAEGSSSQFRVSFVGGSVHEVSRGASPEAPLVARWYMGGRPPTDVLPTDEVGPIVLHVRVIDVLRAHGCTGWSALPVTLEDRQGTPRSDYALLVVTGRCGPVLEEQGTLIEPPEISGTSTFEYRQGIHVDTASWDGASMFGAPGRRSTYVIPAVRQALRQAKVTGVKFTPLAEARYYRKRDATPAEIAAARNAAPPPAKVPPPRRGRASRHGRSRPRNGRNCGTWRPPGARGWAWRRMRRPPP